MGCLITVVWVFMYVLTYNMLPHADLISLLSVADKVGQLGNSAPSIMSLDIPAYQWWSEALHGVAHSPGVTFGGMVSVNLFMSTHVIVEYSQTCSVGTPQRDTLNLYFLSEVLTISTG